MARRSIEGPFMCLAFRPVHANTTNESRTVMACSHSLGIQPLPIPNKNPCTFAICGSVIGYRERLDTGGLSPAMATNEAIYRLVCAMPLSPTDTAVSKITEAANPIENRQRRQIR